MSLKTHCGLIVLALMLLAMALGTSGCVYIPPKRCVAKSYSWGVIRSCPPDVVDSVCDPKFKDDGKPFMRGEHAGGCQLTGDCQIIRQQGQGAWVDEHELAHCDGHDDPKKDGFDAD